MRLQGPCLRGLEKFHRRTTGRFMRAAMAGDAAAQFNVGKMLELGRAGRPSPEEAAKMYRMAAGQGYEPAAAALKGLGM